MEITVQSQELKLEQRTVTSANFQGHLQNLSAENRIQEMAQGYYHVLFVLQF